MTNLQPAAREAPKIKPGQLFVNQILGNWKGPSPVAAELAAYQIGTLVSGGSIAFHRGQELVAANFSVRRVDPKHDDSVRAAFMSGYSSDVTSEGLRERYPAVPANDNTKDDTINAETLLGMDFPPLDYIIPGYIVEGLTVLGGKPKLGKSWWAYDASVAVATGGLAMGVVPCEQGDVLYLALEDNYRRVKDRLSVVCPARKLMGVSLERLSIRTVAPRIDTGLLAELDKWRATCANPRLIIIDVYMKVRPPRKKGEDAYAADYAAVIPLQQYASENRIAVVLVTHTRKMEAEDPLEGISGTNGVTGAADAVLVLNRDSKGTTLYGRGRDIEEIETAMKFDGGRWAILGDADEVRKSDERRRIVTALKEAIEPCGPTALADATGMKAANIRRLVRKMVASGEISQPEVGSYTVPFSKPVAQSL